MKVIQWATGSVGRSTLRRIIDHSQLELVGVYVTNPDKVGLDAGRIAKRPDTGVLATNDIDAILALDADIVIHVPLISVPYEKQNANVIRLLEAGKNVVSTNGFYRPHVQGEDYAAPLHEAAIRGGVTLAGSGLNPGVIAERLVMVHAALMTRLDAIRTSEVFDASLSKSAGLLFNAMAFGTDPAKGDPTESAIAKMYDKLYAEAIDYVAAKLGTSVVSIENRHKITLAPEDMHIAAGTIPKGHVAATTWCWHGVFANGVTMEHKILWTASHALSDVHGDAHWVVELDGRPNIRATLQLTDPDPNAPPSRPAMDATASVLINILPDVVAAAPGFFDLPAPTLLNLR